ncbi:MAG: hypothetical protein ACI8O8_002255, partial [Oleiphilaceae bacterium]
RGILAITTDNMRSFTTRRGLRILFETLLLNFIINTYHLDKID